jgi:hypothetical protein
MDFDQAAKIKNSYENLQDLYKDISLKFDEYYHFLYDNWPCLISGGMSQSDFVFEIVTISTNYRFALASMKDIFPDSALNSAFKLIASLGALSGERHIMSDMYDDLEYLDKTLTTIVVDSSNLVDKLIVK